MEYFANLEAAVKNISLKLDRIEKTALVKTGGQRIGGLDLAVEVTGFATRTIYNLVSQGQIPYKKKKGRLVFEEEKLLEWLLSDPEREVTVTEALLNKR